MNEEQILKAVFTKQSDAIQQVIKRTCIVDFGTVVKVLGENIVEVGISVADSVEDVQLMVCTLISPCSATMSVEIEPAEGDKVLVLSPRHFNPKMFDVDNTDPIIDDTCKGYTRLSGLAVLMNQFNSSSHENAIKANADGSLSITLPKDSLQISKDGDFTLTTPKTTLGIDKDGAITVTAPKASISIDKNGNVAIDTKGKYTIKNDSTDLFKVIKGLVEQVNALVTTGTEATQTISPTSQASNLQWVSTTVASLLEDTTVPVTP